MAVKIKSMKSGGIHETYDIQNNAPDVTEGNFVIDGVVVHNSILLNGVKNFEDLMLLSAMGHPGPMQSIPEAVNNRDDKSQSWQEEMNEEFLKVLKPTYGVIVYQEQLQALWQKVAGFTSPEAQEARKAVAKKWTHKLKDIEKKWLEGASKLIGLEKAKESWLKMTTFGRYAFNKSHGVAYTLLAFRCLWLKAHFAPEFWAAIMSDCHPEKLIRYMGVARTEDWTPTEITNKGSVTSEQISKVQFRALDINNLQVDFSVTDNKVNQGLIGIKGIGESAAAIFAGRGNYDCLDDFIKGDDRKKKNILERFIKLDAFKDLHENSRALWLYYQYYHSSKKELDDSGQEGQVDKKWLESKVLEKSGWDAKAIAEEIGRQIKEYRLAYPKKKVIPNKILNWKPKAEITLELLNEMFPDFSLRDRLEFQMQFIGYYLDNPMDMYETSGRGYIKDAIHRSTSENYLEGIIDSWVIVESEKTGRQFGRLTITDGVAQVTVFVWDSEIALQDRKVLSRGVGVFVPVVYNADKNLFNLPRRGIIMKLRNKDR